MESMTVSQVPEGDLEMTADAVRIARAVPQGTRAAGVRNRLLALHPNAPGSDINRCLGFAAALLINQHN